MALNGSGFPRHALCYQYVLNRWWIEEYPWDVGTSSAWPTIGKPSGQLVGGESEYIWSMWEQGLDGPTGVGTVRSTATSATLMTLVDTLATFPASGVVNAPLRIVYGTGKGQTRRIISVSGTTLTVGAPWLTMPDSTSVYQIGGVEWSWRTGWFRWMDTETNTTRRIETLFQPTVNAVLANQNVYVDFDATPILAGTTLASSDNGGIGMIQGQQDFAIDMTKTTGIVQLRLDNNKEWYTDGDRFMQVGLDGASNVDDVKVYAMAIEGIRQ